MGYKGGGGGCGSIPPFVLSVCVCVCLYVSQCPLNQSYLQSSNLDSLFNSSFHPSLNIFLHFIPLVLLLTPSPPSLHPLPHSPQLSPQTAHLSLTALEFIVFDCLEDV